MRIKYVTTCHAPHLTLYIVQSKCFEYWPAKGEKNVYGPVEVTCAEEDKRAHFVIRTLRVQPVNVSITPSCPSMILVIKPFKKKKSTT